MPAPVSRHRRTTCWSGPPVAAAKTIVPLLLQLPPSPSGASQIAIGVPPPTGAFFNLPSAKNPTHSPSGEKNGLTAPKVPGIGRAVPESSARTISCVVVPRPATYTIARPSGDIVTAPSSVVATRSSSGNVIENFTSLARADEPSRCQGMPATTPTSAPAATNAAEPSHARLRGGAGHSGLRSSRIARRVRRCDVLELQLDVANVADAAAMILLEAAPKQPTHGGGVSAGSVAQSGSFSRMPATMSERVLPSKARRPVSISNSTQPNAQMSVRRSTGAPRACSGLMYGAVPITAPSAVASVGPDGRVAVDLVGLRQPEIEHLDDALRR